MYLENTTDDQENECQHEAICKDEIKRPRYLCIICADNITYQKVIIKLIVIELFHGNNVFVD